MRALLTCIYTKELKARTLTDACVSGCWACYSLPLETASWKRRSNLLSTSGFQLVENARNEFRQVLFWCTTTFCHRQLVAEIQILSYLCIVLRSWRRLFILVLQDINNKHLSIYRNIKSQNDFIKKRKGDVPLRHIPLLFSGVTKACW